MPAEAATPDRASRRDPVLRRALENASDVIPHSMTVNGSVTDSGTAPSAGGGVNRRIASMIRLRRATIGGQ